MTAPAPAQEFAIHVRDGLTQHEQKWLSARFFYDEMGSALFEAITLLPEYGLTRADERVIARCAPGLAAGFHSEVLVAELGSGSGRKTRHILEAFRAGQRALDYYPIDVSQRALETCRGELAPLARVTPLHCTYLQGIRHLAARRRPDQRLLVLFLGSTIGNFERAEARHFLADVRGCLRPGDGLLLGADLVKPADVMLRAYDDALGVTAAFNLNLLTRMNHELDASFEPRRFGHLALWNHAESRIEMHLCSLVDQQVAIPGAGCVAEFREGETIWTESSHKYTLPDLHEMAEAAGYDICGEWVDAEWPFVEALWLVE
jgi:dimethylhistidine N-methyltransferase